MILLYGVKKELLKIHKGGYMVVSSNQIRNSVLAKGYEWFKGDGVLNIVGVRNSDVGNVVTNLFDDIMTLCYIAGGNLDFYAWPCTTDPGAKGVKEFHNPGGVARLMPGQYRSAYAIGMHQGKYEALCQVKPVRVWRDINKDMVYDEVKSESGMFGINIHHAGYDSTYVENWSEGCSVFKTMSDFDKFLGIVKKFKDKNAGFFTYTLLESKDLIKPA